MPVCKKCITYFEPEKPACPQCGTVFVLHEMVGMPPKVKLTIFWLSLNAFLMGVCAIGFPLLLLTDPKQQARSNIVPLLCFVGLTWYWTLAGVLAAVLIWKRKHTGRVLAWTALPGPGFSGIVAGLLSQEMREYLASGSQSTGVTNDLSRL